MDSSECNTELPSGAGINTFLDGSYELYHQDGGYLAVDTDGTTVYHPRPNNDLEMLDSSRRLHYVMRHFSDIICETVDNEGNLFTVSKYGESSVISAHDDNNRGYDGAEGGDSKPEQPQVISEGESRSEERQGSFEQDTSRSRSQQRDESDPEIQKSQEVATSEGVIQRVEQPEETVQSSQKLQQSSTSGANTSSDKTSPRELGHYKQHAPRFFIIEPDGSGTQLLRYQDVADYVIQAEEDHSTAMVMEELTDNPSAFGLTVLHPYLSNVSEQWITHPQPECIIPPGLKSRDLMTFPAKEVKTDGPAFGTAMGKGLMVGSLVNNPPMLPAPKCPSMLEIRQLIQYQPVSETLREKWVPFNVHYNNTFEFEFIKCEYQ